MKCPAVQSGVHWQIWNRKLLRISPPRGVWCTSGWNCTPYSRRSGWAKAAIGLFALEALTSKPSARPVMRSPWLIHTCERSPGSKPANSVPGSRISISARPYSRSPAGSTVPPAARLSRFIP
jgi:hypothetical protein